MVLTKQMKLQILVNFFLAVLLVINTTPTNAIAAEDKELIVDGNTTTIQHSIPVNPIVIQTQLQNYDEPTLKEYQECFENREKCKQVCQGVEDVGKCLKECPNCPELSMSELLVQGVNDTQFTKSTKPFNTTNVIRLTNQIHNLIESNEGNITLNNDNNVHLHQDVKASRVGGKFGLGYNNTDPCCIVLRSRSNCDMQRFSTASRCHRKRHRVCGKQCKSRVMEAKRVTVCDSNSDFQDYFDDNDAGNCRETVKYVPFRPRRHSKRPAMPGRTLQQLPQPNCDYCLRLPFAYILLNGMPFQCSPCFNSYYGGYNTYNYPQPFLNGQPFVHFTFVNYPPNGDDLDDFDISDGWKEDKRKCLLPDGEVSSDCPITSPNDFEIDNVNTDGPDENETDYYDYDHDDLLEGPVVRRRRRRRQTFLRSKYSRKYRTKA
ncbi:uncharacterized protein LOC101889520 [Musca domestica]|uniref:Uncharacterized protein LOC101889520 n=2 Tax=Musca domestica TaxID=7370 RepID=A0A9J7CM25_MUSDO|nr:uncharacterized protein LOC101889520 [Musca domestica]